MRVVFMGSAAFSCPALNAVREAGRDEVVGVVCQPDRPQGRHLAVRPCPVRAAALTAGIPALTPDRVNAAASVAEIRAFRPEVAVVVAYGQILSPAVLAIPPRGCLNIHASLLPRYRGAAPIQWAVAAGEAGTGVTAIFMNERMDAGDIIRQRSVPIGPDDTGGSLLDRLAAEGAALLVAVLDDLRDGRMTRTPQAEAEATLAPKLRKEDGRIVWTWPAERVHNRVRGFNPWPGCFCREPAGGRALKLLKTRVEAGGGPPGTVLDAAGEAPLVAAGGGAVRLLHVQPEGRKAMSGADYAHGHHLQRGDVLG